MFFGCVLGIFCVVGECDGPVGFGRFGVCVLVLIWGIVCVEIWVSVLELCVS